MATTLRGKRHSEDNTQDKDYYDLPSNVNNKGFVYEEYIFELLKDHLVPADSLLQVLIIVLLTVISLKAGQSYNLEIKLDEKADYGQSGLKYNVSTKNGSLTGKNTIQDRTMRQI